MNVALCQPENLTSILGEDGVKWHLSQTISARLANIGPVSEIFEKFCLSRSNADSAVPMLGPDMNLVLSELLTNIVKHAYCSDGLNKIEIRARFQGQFLEVLIVDQGSELPELVLKKTEIDFDGDDLFGLPEGGFGWGIVHSIIDEIEYQRTGGCNRLLLRKNVFFNLGG